MLVIDLIKEMPKKIRIFNDIYEWDEVAMDYRSVEDRYYFLESYNIFDIANTEIEIIEEDKSIKSIDSEYFYTSDTRYNELIDEIALNRELIIKLKKESK
jgi:hypothetical protein